MNYHFFFETEFSYVKSNVKKLIIAFLCFIKFPPCPNKLLIKQKNHCIVWLQCEEYTVDRSTATKSCNMITKGGPLLKVANCGHIQSPSHLSKENDGIPFFKYFCQSQIYASFLKRWLRPPSKSSVLIHLYSGEGTCNGGVIDMLMMCYPLILVGSFRTCQHKALKENEKWKSWPRKMDDMARKFGWPHMSYSNLYSRIFLK